MKAHRFDKDRVSHGVVFSMTWENRWHPLLERWVTITGHRGSRPWQGGQVEAPLPAASFDPTCYLCPGGQRISGQRNPEYDEIFVFDNDHPAFSVDAPPPEPAVGLFESQPAEGICRVMCYSPNHGLRLSQLGNDQLLQVIEVWRDQTFELMTEQGFEQVFIFENNGEVVGVSNPHPHCQIFATSLQFSTLTQELQATERYRAKTEGDLFDAMIRSEREDGRRILYENSDWLGFVPYFAELPYEIMLLPKGRRRQLFQMPNQELESLSVALRQVLVMLDHLWSVPQSYILSIRQAPLGLPEAHDYRCYLKLQPLLRGPGLQKYLAGIETGAGHFLNDGVPEIKAEELRAAGQGR